MTKMVSGKEPGQRQKCLPACQESNFNPTSEISAAYPPTAKEDDEKNQFYNNPDFCVLLVKLIDYCEDPYIKKTLDASGYEDMTDYSKNMCSRLNEVN